MEKQPRNYGEMTVAEVRAYLQSNDTVLIPVGSIEQHGNHLPNLADSINAEGFCREIAERMGFLYMPAVYTSFSGGDLPGTINFRPETLLMVLRDLCTSLAGQGFRNLFLVLSHGGSENLTMLETGLPLMLRENPLFDSVLIAFMPWWRYCPTFEKGIREGDGHGGGGGTSLLLYFRPDLVTDRVEVDAPEVLERIRRHPDAYQKHETLFDGPEVLARVTQDESVRIGVMGDPTRASAEYGRALVKEAVDAMTERIGCILAERAESYVRIERVPGEIKT